MAGRRMHTQMFALPASPPARLTVRGRAYELLSVFKHDFFAATTLYQAVDGDGAVVVKFGRTQPFCGLGGAWVGRLFLRRERRFHQRMEGVGGVQRWIAQISPTAYALQYVEGRTLDTCEGFLAGAVFDGLRSTLDAIHARGGAYADLNKRSNIVITPDGRAVLIDFQISMLKADAPAGLGAWLLDKLVTYLQAADLYHLYKHKRRFAPEELTVEQMDLSERRGRLIGLHRRVVTPLRRLRRAFLRRLHRTGRLVSPTAHLEDHDQPEKATWRH